MSEDQSKRKSVNLPAGQAGLKGENEHFPEDDHAPKSVSGPEPGVNNPQKPVTENMEVHKHPHHVTHKKKWSEYLLEFLMLFLAVFLGFLAEYQLEHVIEKQREKDFIRSFIGDLKSDTSFIAANHIWRIEKKKGLDSLIWYLNSPDPNQYGQRIYFLARQLTRNSNFFPSDGTIKQLKNSGGFRLIKNQAAVDSIMAYDKAVELILLTQSRQENEFADIRPMMGKLMDANILETMIDGDQINPPPGNPALRTINKEFILDFIYAIHQLKGSLSVTLARMLRLQEEAASTIVFLKKEYHIE